MTFAWPWLLASLLLVPLATFGYLRLLERAEARRRRLAATGLVARAPTGRSGALRHLAPGLLLAALAVLGVGLARPTATVNVPHREGTVVLAFDTSASMAATDVAPTRMAAAKTAAQQFVRRQPPAVRIAVVAFGGQGLVTQPPTTDRNRVLAAVDRLQPEGGTALARGIQTSLSAIAGHTVALEDPEAPDSGTSAPAPDLGYFSSAAVVLLSDGENTDDPDPQLAAELASTAGVKVYPVGLGSPQGTVLTVDGYQVATRLDEAGLQQIARTTDGQYFPAADAATLEEVYSSIDLGWTARGQKQEITGLLALVALGLVVAAAGVTVVRTGRVI
ncbi:VWA domain-containing protein [Spongisporangium articulatum]|uniref:VWA domain-containing protein n=1 Tax=Spongisporangium articulatum TaxID=3362603 RepID=A0ABW8AMU9_9ACTN